LYFYGVQDWPGGRAMNAAASPSPLRCLQAEGSTNHQATKPRPGDGYSRNPNRPNCQTIDHLPDKHGRTAVDQLDRAALKAGAGIETKFVTAYWQIWAAESKNN